jgi:hypothetical protein
MEPGEEFRRWLNFTFRGTADRLVIQDRPASTTTLDREQAEAMIAHLRVIAEGLPTLADRLDGMDRCPECTGRGKIPCHGLDSEADCPTCDGSGLTLRRDPASEF